MSSKVMYTEFKVYQLNFKPSCPSNPHPLSNKRKYIMVSQLYYIAALSLMRKSYKPNEWPKTVIHDHVPVQLHISLPQHHWVVALQLWEPQGPEQRQLLLSRQEQREELRLRGWELLTSAWDRICTWESRQRLVTAKPAGWSSFPVLPD